MKKCLSILLISLLLLAGCKKDNNPTSTYQSWSFQGVTYNTAVCIGSEQNGYGNLDAISTTVSNHPGSTLKVILGRFIYDLNGTYTIVNSTNLTSSQAQIILTINDSSMDSYYSTGGNGRQTITVNADSSNVAISGNSIQMFKGNSPGDSATITFNISEK